MYCIAFKNIILKLKTKPYSSRTLGVAYCMHITCFDCPKVYARETCQLLEDRIFQHKKDVPLLSISLFLQRISKIYREKSLRNLVGIFLKMIFEKEECLSFMAQRTLKCKYELRWSIRFVAFSILCMGVTKTVGCLPLYLSYFSNVFVLIGSFGITWMQNSSQQNDPWISCKLFYYYYFFQGRTIWRYFDSIVLKFDIVLVNLSNKYPYCF